MKESLIKKHKILGGLFLMFGCFQLYRAFKLTPGAIKEINKIIKGV